MFLSHEGGKAAFQLKRIELQNDGEEYILTDNFGKHFMFNPNGRDSLKKLTVPTV